MERINLLLVKRFWALAKGYWEGDRKWIARGLLVLLIVLLLVYTGLSVLLNTERGALISALSTKDEDRFWQTVLYFIGILVIYAPLFAGYSYLQKRLGVEWRKWLTDRFINRYFANRAFYHLNSSNKEIDNPDQRIAEDVKSFTVDSLEFMLVIVGSVLEIIAFSGVLWGISRSLVIFLVIYAILGTFVAAFFFGKPLVRLNFEQLKKEANFRFSMVRIRENAEAIAFYRGETRESDQVKNRFLAAFDNYKKLISWQLNLNVLTNFYEFLPFIIPALVVAPSIFAGDLEVGKVTEAQGAFFRVFFSLNVIVSRFESFTNFGAGINRLYGFAEFLEEEENLVQTNKVASVQQSNSNTIQIIEDGRIELKSLTVQTPNLQQTLIEDLSLELPSGQGLLVVGPSGCGKSSLLRALAGLWEKGEGAIVRPALNEILFLPQRPYMILGTLRDQLLYPHTNADVEDEKLKEVLKLVNLADLSNRFGGFEVEKDWTSVLSMGEQQRLSFARLLLSQPDYAILDEATSALDVDNEEYLYKQLLTTETTFISVGHRPTLTNYHQMVLKLSEEKQWQLQPLEKSILL